MGKTDINKVVRAIYGMTKAEAHQQKICLKCKQPAEKNCYSVAGLREYQISGLCEVCFDDLGGEK